jgi:uncharacterized protein (TIGR00730 family)
MIKRITVFCGSSAGNDPEYIIQTMALGKALAENSIELVYGGAKIGLMGAVADGALQAGGKVIGVIPHFLKSKEVAHEGLTELIIVSSMHERKTKMNDLCNGVIALPGGFGTLEELFEMLTWAQLGLHQKPIALFNMNGFYDSLIKLLQNMVDKNLLKRSNFDMLLISNNNTYLLNKMKDYKAPNVSKWISKDEV